MSKMKFKLVRVADGAETPVTGDLLVGRLDDSGLRVTQGLPSRRHAQLTIVENAVWVEDLGSVNGTYINGVRIAAKSQLNAGDRVRFDLEEFLFHAIAPVQVESAATMYRPLAQELAERQPKSASASPANPSSALESESSSSPLLVTPPVTPVPLSVESSVRAKPAENAVEKLAVKPAAESGAPIKRPGAWADPDQDEGSNKTKFMDPAALKVALDAPKAGGALNAVDVPCMVVMSGASRGAKINLQDQRGGVAEWTIGSGADCQVVIADDGVSALHAKLVNDGTRWKLIDQMSANGTYVNGKRSTVSYLSGGDRIALGPVECELHLPRGARVESLVPQSKSRNNKSLLIGALAGGLLLLLALIYMLWLK
jgi:pSer/pThr/pTyr-binding forkhead associated (FHA) protein